MQDINSLRKGADDLLQNVLAIKEFLRIEDFSSLMQDEQEMLNKILVKLEEFKFYFVNLVPLYVDDISLYLREIMRKNKESSDSDLHKNKEAGNKNLP